ncbi:MAG: flagellar hook-basal body complex protein [Pseudomonadota bacterium]
MDNALAYLTLNRQIGLRREMELIANNIANLDTAGFRREGMVFSEVVHAAASGASVSMADGGVRFASSAPGPMAQTGGTFDLALESQGFFAIEDDQGIILTRAGRFQLSPEGFLVTADGRNVLDEGQAPVFLPPGVPITIGADGTVSADGVEQARIGVFTAVPETLQRIGGAGFRPLEGIDAVPVPKLRQGALEGSNVAAVEEIARMIAVSRAYEQVQGLMRDEGERIRESIRTLGQPL